MTTRMARSTSSIKTGLRCQIRGVEPVPGAHCLQSAYTLTILGRPSPVLLWPADLTPSIYTHQLNRERIPNNWLYRNPGIG